MARKHNRLSDEQVIARKSRNEIRHNARYIREDSDND